MPGPDPLGSQPVVVPAGTLARLTGLACAVFLLYAGSFFYFFVDDEAIPLVYARNLLRGRGLIYTSLEGRVEGYSDFLHVLWSAAILAVTNALGFSRIAPLLVGKGISLLAALGILALTAWTLRRAGASLPGVAAALGFLSLSGPLAAWSATSLETVLFALAVAGFAATVFTGDRPRATLLGILLLLIRIDGAIYLAAVFAGALAAEPRRWRGFATIAWPLGVVFAAYHLWRVTYFRSWLTAPMAAKILHRITGSGQDIVKATEVQYVLAYLQTYGWTTAAALALATCAMAAWRWRVARMAIVAVLLLGIYADIVDDWMFGFRFMVALLPFVATIIGLAITRVPRQWSWIAAAAAIAWSGFGAKTFVDSYQREERRPLFWTNMRVGEPAWFGRYYSALATARQVMRPGDRVSYNQAGLIPYMLDVENIDDLGICSRFVAGLPTRDVYFTGVGRYSPLTNDAMLHTAHQYLLYQDVRFIIAPVDLLVKANAQVVPDRLLNNAFERVAIDALGENAFYRRTDAATEPYRTDPRSFTEHVAHTSRIVAASIDGEKVAAAEFGTRLPFLRERTGNYPFVRQMSFDVTFAARDEDLAGLYIAALTADVGGELWLTFMGDTGQPTLREVIPFASGSQTVIKSFPSATRGHALTLVVHSAGPNRVTLTDLRVAGQSPELHKYVRRMLRFPAV